MQNKDTKRKPTVKDIEYLINWAEQLLTGRRRKTVVKLLFEELEEL